ncbi:hypothetical protein AMEX_G10755 [Astyanax mexicanus]|uniref:Ig-like domain-containing protein n=1 Tax=Astyanax mexicanus TaxID=7994 RepID=A0A8T2LT49_ASTMX|nr:hypothetical protein AMEX_G10755 [Astyanax mexicanus]
MFIIFIFSLIQVAVLGVTVEQDQLSWVKEEGKSVYINCRVTDRSTDYIHWYQQKDGEAMTRILYIKHDGTGLTNPQAKEFTVSVNRIANSYNLKIDTLQKSHSAVYYCASWQRGSHSDANHSHPVQKLLQHATLSTEQMKKQ